jgi:predicted HTH domain antitoxin
MTTISFDAPDEALRAVSSTPEDFAGAIRLAAAMFWYSRGDLTMGTAAALAGLSQAEFMHALKQAGQDTTAADLDDLDRELAYLAKRRTRDAAGG